MDPASLEYQILNSQSDFPPPLAHTPTESYTPYADDYAPTPASASAKRGAVTRKGPAGESAKEKKDKMRVQNRAAAERSRAKKRDELTSLELTVQNIQDENHRLRSQLQALLSSAPSADVNASTGAGASASASAPEASTSSAPSDALNLDYETLHTLQTELDALQAKITAASTSNPSAQLASLQSTLAHKNNEADALRDAIVHLRTSREALHTEKEILQREIQGRRILAKAREMVGEDERFEGLMGVPGGLGGGRAVGVERALLDVRGWLDDAVRSWSLTATLPTRPRNGANSGDNLAPLALLAAASSRNGS